MRPPSDQEVRSPVMLTRYLRELADYANSVDTAARKLKEDMAIPREPVPAAPRERLPDQEIVRLGLQDVPRVNNYTATASPTTEDNAAQGYVVGSEWIYPDGMEVWKCIYADTATATWIQLN